MSSDSETDERSLRWAEFLASDPGGEPCAVDKREWEIWTGRQGVRFDQDGSLLWWSGGPNPHSWGGARNQSIEDFMAGGPVGFGVGDRTPAAILREIVYVIRHMGTKGSEPDASEDGDSRA